MLAVSNLDEVVKIIRGSKGPPEAREKLLAREWPVAEIAPYIKLVEAFDDSGDGDTYRMSDAQVRAILALRLSSLTALGRDEIGGELETLAASITELLEILANRARLYEVMGEELDAIDAAFSTPRRTEITAGGDDIDDEDLIERQDMVVTVTLGGYIKRTPLDTFRTQARGGKGRSGMSTKDEDAVTKLFVTSTHTPVLFFSTAGKVYRMKVWKLPEGAPQARGRPMVNLLPLAAGETISTVLPLPENEAEWKDLHILFATAKGLVRRNSMDQFTRVPTAGKIAMRFSESDDDDAENSSDRLIGVTLLTEEDDVLLATRGGKAIRFAATDVREFQSRTSAGVRGAKLLGDDEVISLSILRGTEWDKDSETKDAYLKAAPWKEGDREATLPAEQVQAMADAEEFVMTVCANGYGKRSSAYEYRRTNRGGQGITNIDNLARNGPVVASFPAHKGEQLMLVTDQAKLIRMSVGDTRVIGRGSSGVRLFDVGKDEHVVSAARIEESEDEAETDVRGDIEAISPEVDPQVDGDTGEDLSDGGEAQGPADEE